MSDLPPEPKGKPQSKLMSPQQGSSGIAPRPEVAPADASPVDPSPVTTDDSSVVQGAIPTPESASPSPSSPTDPAASGPAVPASLPAAPAAPLAASMPAAPVASSVPGAVAPRVPAPLAAPQTRQQKLQDWLRHLSPAFVTLTVVSIGSAIFLMFAATSHTTPVGVLLSAAVVTTLAFALDTIICSGASYEAGRRERTGRAVAFALLGGVSAMICAVAASGTLIMILVLIS
jgi:hypothetical protein